MIQISEEIFTQEDLKANKNGNLTIEQKSKIDEYLSSKKNTGKIVSIILLAIFIGIFLIAYFSDSAIKYHINNLTSTGLLWLAIVFGLPLLIYIISKKLSTQTEERKYNIYSLKGVARKMNDGNNDHAATIKINKTTFHVTDNIYNRIEDNKLYTVYYIEFSSWKMILSWERL